MPLEWDGGGHMLFGSDRAPLVRRPTAAVQKSGAYGDEGKAASRPLTVLAALLSAPFGASATTLAAWRYSPRSFAPHPCEQLGCGSSAPLILVIDMGELAGRVATATLRSPAIPRFKWITHLGRTICIAGEGDWGDRTGDQA